MNAFLHDSFGDDNGNESQTQRSSENYFEQVNINQKSQTVKASNE